MPDVSDLETVVGHVLAIVFWNMGENCSAGSRLIVYRSIRMTSAAISSPASAGGTS
ncbi:hypothetical protein HOP51_17370 [Halomonas sp. MCCC 1A11036]|uniref:Aldehyde dehydrogenase family protein n=2 Tax=Billgrantia zhangzhouensis TaxID=2733481 RepID=A0ABS9AJC7_9GAMM|nr:hypothetical protein [Halomonas zhangzhouensis]MCE8021870.1 hypothetical protein [Halomonas zhangzhouensis]